MLLGAHIHQMLDDPEELSNYYASREYRCAYFPEGRYNASQTQELVHLRDLFEKKGIIFAEVGAWKNPFDPDPAIAKANTDYIIDRLAVAEEVNARCTVMLVGSLGSDVNPQNVSQDFYDRSVDFSRMIIDRVKPKRTKMTFELSPFNFLDTAQAYVQYLKDVDRVEAAVHLDPINLISSPRLFYFNGKVMRDAIKTLAPYSIVSMHLKDLKLHDHLLNTHLEEVPLGKGGIDVAAYLRAVQDLLPKDTPVMMEHLPDLEAYDKALVVVRKIAAQENIQL